MVISGGSTSPRVQGVDRFYCPPARRQLRAAAAAAEKEAAEKQKEEKKNNEEVLIYPQKEIAEEEIVEEKSNLESFVASTSLIVPALFFPRRSMMGRRNCEMENTASQPYYNLSDLWESFKEWSAYGAGVPLVLNGTNSVVQYYVPFLSAIQLFVEKPDLRSQDREESDGDSCQEETSSESESEGVVPGCQRREDLPSCTDREPEADTGFSSDDSDGNSNRHQLPVFQFFEHEPPYARQPLADKILTLATKFPELKTYRSCDLLPSSWISVAWYPIYRIPMGTTLQDLDACFLTFHSLSTVLQSDKNMHQEINIPSDKLSLPLLGLASYKFKESLWTSNGPHDRELATNLMQSADEWLCNRQVDHPDYRFFISHHSTPF
ncbi:uncharacterized protein LOC144554722 isoform X1 [Carex rostrata]